MNTRRIAIGGLWFAGADTLLAACSDCAEPGRNAAPIFRSSQRRFWSSLGTETRALLRRTESVGAP